jgi:vacuolar-type H+-ATPase subunit H
MADKDLDQLIASLKSDAIEAAEEEARRILARAEEEARQTEQATALRQQQMLDDAEREAAAIVQRGEQALQQAARDLKLSLQQEIIAMLRSVLETRVDQAFTPDLVRTAITPVLAHIGQDTELVVPAQILPQFSEYIRQQWAGQEPSITFKAGAEGSRNIQIRQAAEGWHYEVSPATITEALYPFLAPHWIDLLEGSSSTRSPQTNHP